MKNPFQSPAVLDFVERVGTAAFLAGGAVYTTLPHLNQMDDIKVALVAAVGSALKYALKRAAVFQATTFVAPAPQAPPAARGQHVEVGG